MSDLDLSSMRIALNGAEPVDPDAVESFVEEAQRFGFPPGAVFPAFGMAELAIGGTFPPPGRGLVMDAVDARVLEHQHVAKPADPDDDGTRKLARLGRPVPGLRMKVVSRDTGEELPERHVGELLIAGTSVTTGYYKPPEASAELFAGEWLKTGDLAYFVEGELVICGRIKDVIIVGGRNVYPQDIERAVGTLDGVRAGNVIAFGVDGYKGKETVIVVAETRTDDVEALRKAVHHRVLEAVGLPARDVMLVKSGTLPKTSSGKLQRSLCRQQYLDETLQLA
jgi:fatty-acyl-CoA synthase